MNAAAADMTITDAKDLARRTRHLQFPHLDRQQLADIGVAVGDAIAAGARYWRANGSGGLDAAVVVFREHLRRTAREVLGLADDVAIGSELFSGMLAGIERRLAAEGVTPRNGDVLVALA